MKVVSIVIPAYNEEKFIGQLLTKILQVPTEQSGFRKEIIVVNDGSKDRTGEIASSFAEVVCLNQKNQGKGRAVQNGIARATGDVVLVQDADLEYDPDDYPAILAEASDAKTAVYGSRTLGQIRAGQRWGRHPQQEFGPWLAGVILSLWTFLLCGQWISDTLTAYKLYPLQFLRNVTVKTHGFETDHELTVKLLKAGYTIREVPVAYIPRSVTEGKKIKPIDGLIAVWTILKYRFVD